MGLLHNGSRGEPHVETGRLQLRLLHVAQNSTVRIHDEYGDAIPVRYILRGLQAGGHDVSFLNLQGLTVQQYDDVTRLDRVRRAPAGITDRRAYRTVERGFRRLQRQLNVPYYAFFDSLRFHSACLRLLPETDVCHEHYGLFSWGAAAACRRRGVPYMLTTSADMLYEMDLIGRPLRGLHRRVARWVTGYNFRAAQRIITVSEPARRRLVEVWGVDPAKILVMPNGVDVRRFAAADVDPLPPVAASSPVIMFVGSFQAWHGIELLVEAFARVRAAVPAARLVLVGDGPARPALEAQIADLGIADEVLVTGLVPHARIPALLARADVVTIPYPRFDQELWFSPLKLYEYMAAGKAIVASAAGQIADVLEDGHSGRLVEPGDVAGLAAAVTGLLASPAQRRRLGANARQAAERNHSWSAYLQRLEETYAALVSHG